MGKVKSVTLTEALLHQMCPLYAFDHKNIKKYVNINVVLARNTINWPGGAAMSFCFYTSPLACALYS